MHSLNTLVNDSVLQRHLVGKDILRSFEREPGCEGVDGCPKNCEATRTGQRRLGK